VLVLDQLEGRAATRLAAFLAMSLEQARNVLVEGQAGAAGRGRSGAAG